MCEKELVMSETLKVTSFDHTSTTKVAVLGNYRQMRGKSSVRTGIFFAGGFFASSSPVRDLSIHRLTGRFTSIKIPCSTNEEEEDGAFAMTAAMEKGILNSHKRKIDSSGLHDRRVANRVGAELWNRGLPEAPHPELFPVIAS